MKRRLLIFGAGLLLLTTGAWAAFDTTGTTSVSVTVGPEASIQVNTATTTMTTGGTTFAAYTGNTSLTYKIRTTLSGGSGAITAQVTSDFSGTGGPSVGTPPTAGDTLSYTCTVSSPGTACSGSQTASLSTATSVATFSEDAHSVSAGNSASTAWTLTNDPLYKTGTFAATVTYTISAT